MSLKQTIENEYKNALKSKDKNKISTYRLILSSIKDLDIVNRSGPNKKETDDEDIKKLLKKIIIIEWPQKLAINRDFDLKISFEHFEDGRKALIKDSCELFSSLIKHYE